MTARAIKRVIVRQLGTLMQHEGLSKTELAKRMKTSRAQLDRLLDPENGIRYSGHAHACDQSCRTAVTDGVGLIHFPWTTDGIILHYRAPRSTAWSRRRVPRSKLCPNIVEAWQPQQRRVGSTNNSAPDVETDF